jgi:transcriptional regulator with XRE-family HTH domain
MVAMAPESETDVDMDRRWTLAVRVGQLLQNERAMRRLAQATVAERAGTTQQQVSLVERGLAQPTTALLDRLFGALDLQVRVDPEPIGTDSDAEIARYERFTEADRAEWLLRYERTLRRLDGMPYVLTGRLAAFVQGVPVDAPRLDLAVVEEDLGRWSDWFQSQFTQRWNERWHDYGGLLVDPRIAHLPMRWEVGYDEVRFEIGAALPDAVSVTCGELPVRVRPLGDLEADYSDLHRVMQRIRSRGARPGPA